MLDEVEILLRIPNHETAAGGKIGCRRSDRKSNPCGDEELLRILSSDNAAAAPRGVGGSGRGQAACVGTATGGHTVDETGRHLEFLLVQHCRIGSRRNDRNGILVDFDF